MLSEVPNQIFEEKRMANGSCMYTSSVQDFFFINYIGFFLVKTYLADLFYAKPIAYTDIERKVL